MVRQRESYSVRCRTKQTCETTSQIALAPRHVTEPKNLLTRKSFFRAVRSRMEELGPLSHPGPLFSSTRRSEVDSRLNLLSTVLPHRFINLHSSDEPIRSAERRWRVGRLKVGPFHFKR
jgi:hypothetical protein